MSAQMTDDGRPLPVGVSWLPGDDALEVQFARVEARTHIDAP